MMNDQKRIEEMAKVIKSSLDGLGSGSFNFTGDEISTMFAKHLYNATFRKQSEWISVDERLPEKDGRYLVAMKNGDGYHVSTRKFRRADPPIWWKGHTFGYWAKYTGGVRYWMPLPEPPKKGGDVL